LAKIAVGILSLLHAITRSPAFVYSHPAGESAVSGQKAHLSNFEFHCFPPSLIVNEETNAPVFMPLLLLLCGPFRAYFLFFRSNNVCVLALVELANLAQTSHSL
jgi:hypothetical protein